MLACFSTQAHAETNMEIAAATRRDSKHMRSIALLTMVFLPGTFIAVGYLSLLVSSNFLSSLAIISIDKVYRFYHVILTTQL